MGLKWFRKRLKIRKVTASSDVPGFYRKFSHYDISESTLSLPTTSQSEMYTGNVYKLRAVPSTGALNNPQCYANEKKLNNNSDQFTDRNGSETNYPNYQPRASIDLAKDGNSIDKNIKSVANKNKAEIKKKKGRAPLPQPAYSNDNDTYDSNKNEILWDGIKSHRESKVEI